MFLIQSKCVKLLQSCFNTVKRPFNSRALFSSSAVPSFPQWKEIKTEDLPPPRSLTKDELEHLESISLVQYRNTAVEKARLEDIIRFADSLHVLDTNGVEPMIHVFDDECLRLRDDVVTDHGCSGEVLKNAKISEEDYFVAPPGNIALLDSKKLSTDDINNINAQNS